MSTPERPRFRVVVRPEGSGPPAEIRLRRFLKDLLRRAGLRCVAVDQLPESGCTVQPVSPPAAPDRTEGVTPDEPA
jgi:hypothetical protein